SGSAAAGHVHVRRPRGGCPAALRPVSARRSGREDSGGAPLPGVRLKTNGLSQMAAGRPTYYITTAISYPNGAPHIGHAYEAIATDAIARFKRLDGHDVYFQTGTDEHGLKMVQTATRAGVTPRE